MRRTNKFFLLALSAVAALTLSSRATLLVYEPFDYATGALTGQNGGTGFASAWQHYGGNKGKVWWPNSIDTNAGGNSWDGAVANIPTSSALGEYRFAGGDETVGAYNRDIYRALSSSAGAMAGGDNVLWMSVVALNGSGGSFGLGLGDGYTRDRGRNWEAGMTNFIGWAGYTTTWIQKKNAMISTNAPARDIDITQDTAGLSSSSPYVLVFKFTFSAGDDTCQMYAFDESTPLSEATFDASALTATVAGFDENACDVFSYAHNGQQNLLDEIRIGDSFADVASLSSAGQTDPAKSSVGFAPIGVPADGTSISTITVTVLDGFSTPQAGDSIVLTGSTGNATVSPVTQTTDASGQAVFTVKSNTSEIELFTASNTTDSVAIWQTASVAFQAGTGAGVSTVTGTRDLLVADGASTSTTTVTLLDSATATPIVGHSVTLAGSTGNATITPVGSTVSDSSGQVSFDVSSSTVETEVFTATDTTEPVGITETFSVTFAANDSASLLVYEPFDYAVGALAGNSNGIGFASGSAWATPNGGAIGWVWDPNNGTVLSQGDMDWDGVMDNIPVSTALGENRFTGGAPDISEAKRDIYRELATSAGEMAGTDGVLWMSAVLHRGANSGVGLGLGLGDTVLRDRGGASNFQNPEVGAQTAFVGSFGWRWFDGGGDNNRLNPAIATGKIDTAVANIDNYDVTLGPTLSDLDYVLVLKFRFSGFEDSVEGYAFPESTELIEATFDSNKLIATFTSGFDQDACNLVTWSSARGSSCLDEIRIGSTFDDVIGIIPTPSGTLIFIK